MNLTRNRKTCQTVAVLRRTRRFRNKALKQVRNSKHKCWSNFNKTLSKETLCLEVVEPSSKRTNLPPLLLLDENGLRLYQCEIPNCSKTFRLEQDLLTHRQAKHQKYNKSAFTCYFCGRRLIRKDSFYEHILKKHVKELPESCIVMGCGFKAPGKLAWKTHLESKHPRGNLFSLQYY